MHSTDHATHVPSSESEATPAPKALYFNREISWLEFNRRVLELAQDRSFPLLERVKFLAIFSSNLDEFFMKRVGGLLRQRAANVCDLSIDGMNVQQQLDAIHAHVLPMLRDHARCWQDDLEPALV